MLPLDKTHQCCKNHVKFTNKAFATWVYVYFYGHMPIRLQKQQYKPIRCNEHSLAILVSEESIEMFLPR